MRLPLVFSTTNDDVVASCSVRENKRERDISKTCSRLSLDGPHKREKSDEKGRCGSLSCRLQKSVFLCPFCVHLKKKISSVKTQFFPQNSSFVFTCLGFKIERDKKKRRRFEETFCDLFFLSLTAFIIIEHGRKRRARRQRK